MAKMVAAQTAQPIPLDVVGGTKFGRYPMISVEQTFNMLVVSENDPAFMIPFAGYQFQIALSGNGRGLFSSEKAGQMFSVAQNNFYKIGNALNPSLVRTIASSGGDVFMDEDILGNIAICDGSLIYIYNYNSGLTYTAGTNPYLTGTVSQSGTTVTGSGTTFTASMVGGNLYFDDKTQTTITAFNSATSLTVSTSATKTGQGYLITSPLDFTPNYVCFHDGRFLSTSAMSGTNQVGQWRLSKVVVTTGGNVYVVFPSGASLPQFQGAFQTKPDLPVAVVRLPGRGNQILIMGSIVSELWTDVGLSLFPYQKNTSFNLDYGCVNPSTIATLGNIVAWVGQNEKSGPVIMYTTGQDIVPISEDGIDYRLANLKFPKSSYGFAFKQDGKVLYVVTFYDPSDNLTLAYDFKEKKFVTLTDENMNFHIAKRTVYFNNTYYFNTITDENIYELNSQFYTYEYSDSIKEIPRVRVCKTFRTKNGVPGVMNNLSFPIEQGTDLLNTQEGSNIAAIDVDQQGSNFTTATVIITGDGKGGAATAVINLGAIVSINITNPGIGYSWAVATICGDGTGAVLNTVLNTDPYIPRVDMSMSYDGAYTFSNFVGMNMNVVGKFKNRFASDQIGYSNEFTPQFRFFGQGRFVVTNGEMNFYQ